MDSQVPGCTANLPSPTTKVLPTTEMLTPANIMAESSLPLNAVQPGMGTMPVPPASLPTTPQIESDAKVLAVSTMLPQPQPVTTAATSPVPGINPVTPLSPSTSAGSSAPSQTSHRSRKEKLIVRSDADTIEVQGTAITPLMNKSEPSVPADSEQQPTSVPTTSTKAKKPDSPVKTPRTYRRKHASESDKKRDSLTKKVLVSNAQRRHGLGQEQPKKASKRRNTVSVVESNEFPPPPLPNSPPKVHQSLIGKSPSPKKSGRGHLSQQEEALLPMLLKNKLPRTLAPTAKNPPPSPAPPNTTNNGDKRLDLRFFGLSNVLPIFKPNQKPWNLLKHLLENTEDDETRKRLAPPPPPPPTQALMDTTEVKSEPPPPMPRVGPVQNLDCWNSDDSESDDSDDSSSSTDTANEDPNEEMDELEVVAVPVSIQGGQVSFPPEAQIILNQLLSSKSQDRSQQARVRMRTESESSLPGFNPPHFATPLPRPSSTPAASCAETDSSSLKDFDQSLSKSSDFQFKPLDAPVSPGGLTTTNSKWPWVRNGRESPFGGGFSRFQTASPSSGSSTNGNSGRRYSRRRHSRMYPPFEASHCMYTKHFCPAPLEPGSTYCIKHVSEKYSPYYVRCAFVSAKTGRRCQNMQYSKDGKNKFCNMHASRLALLRQKLYRKPRPIKEVKDHFNEMRHTQKKLKKPKRTEAVAYLEDYCDYKLQTQCMENEIEVVDPMEEMNLTVEDLCKFQVDHDSDGGCELEDEYECLKNAGYYSTEEVVRILKSKLSKLRELYVKEFDFLKLYYLLKRQEYLISEDKLRSSGLKVSRNPKTLFRWKHLVSEEFIRKEIKSYEKNKVLLNYHKLRGQTAVLHHLAKKRYEALKRNAAKDNDDGETESDDENPIVKDVLRIAEANKDDSSKIVGKCKYDDGIITCEKSPLPSSDFCHHHVLSDHRQVLFQPCNYPAEDNEFCQIPLLKKVNRSGCDYHRIFRLKRFIKSKAEKDARYQLLKSLPTASFKEHVKMLEDLLASKVNCVEEFDSEVAYLFSKGLDCSDTSVSDNENDFDYQVNDEDEEEEEECPGETDGIRRKRPHNKTRRRHFGPGYSKRQRLRMDSELLPTGGDSPFSPAEVSVSSAVNGSDLPEPSSILTRAPPSENFSSSSLKDELHCNGEVVTCNGLEKPMEINSEPKVPNGHHLGIENVNGNDDRFTTTTSSELGNDASTS